MEVGDLVKLKLRSCHPDEFGVVIHMHEPNPEDALHLEDYSRTASVLCEDGIWTIMVDDLEVVNESR